jgi:hypothetical protein
MVIHPVGPTTARTQVLAVKPGEWQLSISAHGTVEWAVNLGGHMVVASGKTVLQRQQGITPGGYVVKATHAGGDVKVFVCAISIDFKCHMPNPDGVAHGLLPLITGVENVTFGGERVPETSTANLTNGFEGAMEEIFFYAMSLERVQAFLFSAPVTGCVDWYIFDYTNPEARTWWAQKVARMFNAVGAAVSQWDGAEFQGTLSGWDLPHSAKTVSSGLPGYWTRAQGQASLQSSKLWKQRTAVEGGGGGGGLGPWKADMSPFADEASIKGPLCGPGGDDWHERILFEVLTGGMMMNGYHTGATLPRADLDCFVGGLVATGIAPQMSGLGNATQMARVKYWLDLFDVHGMATESTITALQVRKTPSWPRSWANFNLL